MPIIERNFNDEIFGRFLGRKIYNFIIQKRIVVSRLSEQLGKPQSYLSNILNGRRVTKNVDQYRVIAYAAGISKDEFDGYVSEARREEFKQSAGADTSVSAVVDMDALEKLNLDETDLIKVWMKKKFGRTPTDDEIKRGIKLLMAAEEGNL